jgi:hypothetical protein
VLPEPKKKQTSFSQMTYFQRLGIPLVIALALQAVIVIYYLIYELKFHGLGATLMNKFVMISLLGNVFAFLNLIDNIIHFLMLDGVVVMESETSGNNAIDLFALISFWGILSSHLTLVMLRSEAVFRTFGRYLLGIRSALVLFFLLETMTAVLLVTSWFDSFSSFDFIAEILELATMSLFSSIDVIATYAFFQYVREIDATLNQATSLVNNQLHGLQRSIIVKRSALICFLTTVSVLMYWIVSVIPVSSKQGVDALEMLSLVEEIILLICMILWLTLKMELDAIAADITRQQSPTISPKIETSGS